MSADDPKDEEPDTDAHAPASEDPAPGSVDFASFVLSLGAAGILFLSGESDDERVPGGKINLKEAAQHIDILAMLERKTRGNLTKQEQDLLQSVLYDLRMQYLEVARGK